MTPRRARLAAALALSPACSDAGAGGDAPGLPEPLALAPGTLPGALFAEDAGGFAAIDLEIDEAEWRMLCDNGAAAAAAFAARQPHRHRWARAGVRLGDEAWPAVGLRFLGRSTVQNLFAEAAEDGTPLPDPLGRCRAAFAPGSRRYHRESGEGTFRFKPSFKLDFREIAGGGDFHGLRRLNLVGETGHQTLLDEWLPATLYARAGLAHARTGHVVLRVNGVYRGVYMVEEQIDQQPWLDHHFPGMEPAQAGAFYRVDAFGPLALQSDEGARLREQYEPRAGTPDPDPAEGVDNPTGREPMADLIDLLRAASVETAGDDAAFRAEMEARLDVTRWLRLLAIETATGDVDGLLANGNNYVLVLRGDGRWQAARSDPDASWYWWDADARVRWPDWPGVSAARGPSLLCLRPSWNRRMPNCPDGTLPLDPVDADETVEVNPRHPVLAARMLHAFRGEYLDAVEELLDGALAPGAVRELVERRALLVEPWLAHAEDRHLDPWGWSWDEWRFNVWGDAGAPAPGDCGRHPCKLVDSVQLYLDSAREQLALLREPGGAAGCPRDEPEEPSYQELIPCPGGDARASARR